MGERPGAGSPVTAPAAANPFALLASAARGDLVAQRALAHSAMLRFYDTKGNPRGAEHIGLGEMAALIEGLAFARMAASHGDENDRNRLIAMLTLGRILPPECSAPIEAELLARASMWTEQSGLDGAEAESADLMLNQFADEAAPHSAACAPIYRQLILESEAG